MGLLNKQKFYLRVAYNNVIVFTKKQDIKPIVSWFMKKSKVAYLIPPEINPIRDGNLHEIRYEQSDSTPLADLIDVIPDQVKLIEPLIATAVITGIDNLLEDETNGSIIISKPFREQLERIKNWMNRYQGTKLIYQLWRWGYFKGETWYKCLHNADREKIEAVVFPQKLSRVGMKPQYLYEREKSTMVPDILRRTEPKWAWLADVLPWIAIGLGIAAFGWFLFHH